MDAKINELEPEDYEKAKLVVYKGLLSIDPLAVDIRLEVANYYLRNDNHRAAFIELHFTLAHGKATENNKIVESTKRYLREVKINEFEKDFLMLEFYYRIQEEKKYHMGLSLLKKNILQILFYSEVFMKNT